MIHARTLGPVALAVEGAAPPPELLWRKNLGLLLYLARSPRGARSREHLVGLFWADKPEAAARHSLNEAIRTLRSVLGDERVDTSGGQVRLDPAVVHLDVAELEQLAGAGDWAGAAALAGGQFCEGFAIAGGSAFEDWLAAERAHWTQRQVDVLLRWAEEQECRGSTSGAMRAAERALRLEPTSEPALRMRLRSLALAGDRNGALACFDRFRRDLTEQLGIEPGPETLALVERLKHGQAPWRRGPARPSPAAETRRIPLTGRERDLERVLGAAQASRLGPRATVVVVEGHPGVGRTRLIEEVAERAALDGSSVIAARAVAADRGDPASGILALARGGLLEAPGIAGAPSSALESLASHSTEWAERFRIAPAAETVPLGRALVEVVRAAAAERPVVLIVDDAQFLDADSYGALEILLRDLARAPVALLLSTTAENPPAELDAIRARFGRDVAGEVVRLQPLASADVERLVAHVIPDIGAGQRDRIARRVLTDSAGLPLLAVELLHAIASGLEPEELAGGWPAPLRTLDHTLPGDLPDTLVAAIRVGFRLLGGDAQRTLATAAVLGDRVTPRELAAITGLPDDRTIAALDELEWSRWLVADPRGYAFTARIVRDVVGRDMLTPGQRQRIAERRAALAEGGAE